MEGSKTPRDLIVFVMAAALVGSLLVLPAAASNSQGLYWGISVGQRFDYMVSHLTTVDSSTETAQQRYYIIVSLLFEIKEHVVAIEDLWNIIGYSVYYENGTAMGPIDYTWSGLPVGNWSLIISLWLSRMSLTQEDIIDTPVLAGYNYTYETAPGAYVFTEIYQKSTGVLYYDLVVFIQLGGAHNVYSRTEVSLIEDNSWTLVAVGGAVVVGAIVAVVALVLKRRQ